MCERDATIVQDLHETGKPAPWPHGRARPSEREDASRDRRHQRSARTAEHSCRHPYRSGEYDRHQNGRTFADARATKRKPNRGARDHDYRRDSRPTQTTPGGY